MAVAVVQVIDRTLESKSFLSFISHLLFFAVLALYTLVHPDLPDVLLAEEVPDLDQGPILGDGAVDGEMGVDGAHLVLVALKQTTKLVYCSSICQDLSIGKRKRLCLA